MQNDKLFQIIQPENFIRHNCVELGRRTNDLLVAVSHSTSHICSTFVANLIATLYEMCRTSAQHIRTSTNVEGRQLLHYFNFYLPAQLHSNVPSEQPTTFPFYETTTISLFYNVCLLLLSGLSRLLPYPNFPDFVFTGSKTTLTL